MLKCFSIEIQSRQRKAVTYAALPSNGLPIQRNYGIARGNERHQPVSTHTSCLHICLSFSKSNIKYWISNIEDEILNVEYWMPNIGADTFSNVDVSSDGAFWAGWLRGRSGVRILSRGKLPLSTCSASCSCSSRSSSCSSSSSSRSRSSSASPSQHPLKLLTHCHRTCVNLNKGTVLQKHYIWAILGILSISFFSHKFLTILPFGDSAPGVMLRLTQLIGDMGEKIWRALTLLCQRKYKMF